MSCVALNWRDTALGIALFKDLADPGLMHYGPSTRWSAPTIQTQGNSILFRAQVDFGVPTEILVELQAKFPGVRLAALAAVDVKSSVALNPVPPAPHVAELALIPSLPFPSLSASISLSKNDPACQALAESISRAWQDRSLLSGGVTFTVEGRTVRSATGVTLQLRQLHQQLSSLVLAPVISRDAMVTAVASCVAAHAREIISSRVPGGSVNDDLAAVQSFVVGKVCDLIFRPARDLVDWDSGAVLPGVELQPIEGLAATMSYTLNRSVDDRVVLRTLG